MSENINIFEQASRVELRFPFRNCGVGDLWNLSVQRLDGIFQILNAKPNAETEESLLGPKSGGMSELGLQVAIIRHIVGVKLAEAAAAEAREVHRQKNAMIDGILAGKQEDKLRDMAEEELLQLREDV